MWDAKFKWFLALKGFRALSAGSGNRFGVDFEGHDDFAIRVFGGLAPAEYQSYMVVDERFLNTGQLRHRGGEGGRVGLTSLS